MEFDLSEDQRLMQETTRRFLASEVPLTRVRELIDDPVGFDRGAYGQGAELGWFSMLVPEADGGGSMSGEAVTDAAIIVEELGRAIFAGPVIPANIVADAIARFGSDAQRAAHLPGIVNGETLATWAFAEDNDRWDAAGVAMTATAADNGFVLSGTKCFVQDAHIADVFLVTARTEQGVTQFLVPANAPGLAIVELKSLDVGRRFADVTFDGTSVPADSLLGAVGGATEAVERQRDVALALVSAETVGALDACFEMTLEYMHSRNAFGRPIGSFQALKHRLADMALWLESAKATAVAAAKAVDHDIDRADSASVAKSYISDRGPAIVRDCLQLHGGIGYTWEFDLHLYLRRVESNAALYGGTAVHQDRLATIIGFEEASA